MAYDLGQTFFDELDEKGEFASADKNLGGQNFLADKTFQRTKFSAPTRNLGSLVRRKFSSVFYFPIQFTRKICFNVTGN